MLLQKSPTEQTPDGAMAIGIRKSALRLRKQKTQEITG